MNQFCYAHWFHSGMLFSCRLPIWHRVCDNDVLWRNALADIAKTRDGYQRTPLMAGLGAARFVNDICDSELLAAAGRVRARDAAAHPVSHMAAAMAPPANTAMAALAAGVDEALGDAEGSVKDSVNAAKVIVQQQRRAALIA